MKLLVTGGNGFVGINVINEIIKTTNWEIVCFVNKNADRLPKHITQVSSLQSLTSDTVFDVIIHAGGNPSSKSCILNPTDAFQSNIDFTFKLLEYARSTNVKKIIFFSSCEVYGFATDTSCETDMLKSYNMYGASKIACEHMCSAYYHTYGISTVAIRLLNTYGPYCQEERFPSIIEKKFETEEIPHFILTNKTSKRWLDIREMARRTVFIINHMPVGFETFNFVGDENLNLSSFIEKLSNQRKFTYEYIETPVISGYHHEANADGTKYRVFEQTILNNA